MSLWKGKSFDIYNNSSDPSAPDTGYVSLYFKNNFPYWKTSGNKTYRILDDTTAISARPSLTSAIASADELLIDDAGTLKRTSISNLQSYMQNNLTFSSGGYTFTWNGFTVNDGNIVNNIAGNGLTTTNTSDIPGVYDSIIKLHELNTEATQATDFDYMAVIDSSWNWKYMTKANVLDIVNGGQIQVARYRSITTDNNRPYMDISIPSSQDTFVYEGIVLYKVASTGTGSGYGFYKIKGFIQRGQTTNIISRDHVEIENTVDSQAGNVTGIVVYFLNDTNIRIASSSYYTNDYEMYLHMSYSLPTEWN